MGMSLSTETGNALNHILSSQPKGRAEPTKGMGATLLGFSDRYAATIIAIDGDIITVQEDRATRLDSNGASENQSYEYSADPDAPARHYQRKADGSWEQVTRLDHSGRWEPVTSGYGLLVGKRDHFFDFTY